MALVDAASCRVIRGVTEISHICRKQQKAARCCFYDPRPANGYLEFLAVSETQEHFYKNYTYETYSELLHYRPY
jgi:hypothetical protein